MKNTLFSTLLLSSLLFAACTNLAPEMEEEATDMMESDSVEAEEMMEEEAMEDETPAEESAGVSEFMAFDAAAYEAALAEGKTVFLDFHADWCPTCVANAPKIASAFDQLGDENVVGFEVNYDTEKELAETYGVKSQSTLVVVPAGDVSAARANAGGLVTADEVLEFIRG